jgi:hypothetical protein
VYSWSNPDLAITELKIEELWYSIYFISFPYPTEDISVSIIAVDNMLNGIDMKTTAEEEASAS